MKKILTTLFVAFLLMGSAETVSAQIIVKVRPAVPAKRVHQPARAKKGHIWIDGHWRWNKQANKYQWVKGHWTKNRAGHRWIPGHWKDVPGQGHQWVPGHWKRV